jgi:hypothetical protein
VARRAGTHPEQQPALGEVVERQGAVRGVGGVPQRKLHDARAELDARRHRGGHGQGHERVGDHEAPPDGVEHPQRGESEPLHQLGAPGDVATAERTTGGPVEG